jgi:hypothetical protein
VQPDDFDNQREIGGDVLRSSDCDLGLWRECVSIKVSDITVDISLGTIVQGKNDTVLKGNANKPYLSLDLSTPNSDILGAADSGGKQITTGAGIVVTGKVVKSGSSKGTFRSEPGAAAGDSFTGTWNCHGAFAKE